MEIRRLFQMLWARGLAILLVFAVTVGVAYYVTLGQTKLYMAWTPIVLDFKTENPLENSLLPAQLSSSYMATQMDILRSRKVADVALKILTTEFPEKEAKLFAALYPGAPALLPSLELEPSRDSRVVKIGFRASDPLRAEQVANAIAEAYIRTTLELNVEPARRNAEWFNDQLVDLRTRLQEAEARLSDFQQEKGIVALDERLDSETSRLNELAKNLVAAQSETYSVQARRLGVNHPEYRRAVERERSVRRSLDRQKSRLLDLNKQRDALELLAREVESERQSYDATLENFYKARLESQFNRTNVSVLSPAVAERKPVSPNVLLNMGSAAFLGLLAGLLFAVALEAYTRPIRDVQDLQDEFGLELLATYE